MRVKSKHLLRLLILVFVVFVLCEYLIYYLVLLQCGWPTLQPINEETNITVGLEEEVRVMLLADTHLLGSRKGHWFDKLRSAYRGYFLCADDSEDCDKVRRGDPTLTIPQMVDPHPLPLPLPMNGFAHSHNGKANGYVPHTINITNNPLAEPHQDKNVMEMSYMSSQNNNCSAESSSGVEGEEMAWRARGSGENYV